MATTVTTTAIGTAVKTSVRRLVLAGLVALLLTAGLAGGREAAAFTRVLRSDDGKLVLVCHYDDRTGELAFCDVYWFPLTASTGGSVKLPKNAAATRVDAAQLSVKGDSVSVAPGAVKALPANAQLLASPSDGDGAATPVAKTGKHHGKGGAAKHAKASRK